MTMANLYAKDCISKFCALLGKGPYVRLSVCPQLVALGFSRLTGPFRGWSRPSRGWRAPSAAGLGHLAADGHLPRLVSAISRLTGTFRGWSRPSRGWRAPSARLCCITVRRRPDQPSPRRCGQTSTPSTNDTVVERPRDELSCFRSHRQRSRSVGLPVSPADAGALVALSWPGPTSTFSVYFVGSLRQVYKELLPFFSLWVRSSCSSLISARWGHEKLTFSFYRVHPGLHAYRVKARALSNVQIYEKTWKINFVCLSCIPHRRILWISIWGPTPLGHIHFFFFFLGPDSTPSLKEGPSLLELLYTFLCIFIWKLSKKEHLENHSIKHGITVRQKGVHVLVLDKCNRPSKKG